MTSSTPHTSKKIAIYATKIKTSVVNMSTRTTSQISKLLPNTIYLTFNAPQVNEYHRGIFLTSGGVSPHDTESSEANGTLFHAIFTNDEWSLERRLVRNLNNSSGLVLMWRIAELNTAFTVNDVEKILRKVPFKADEAGARKYPVLSLNPKMGGFSCLPWTEEALVALQREGMITVNKAMSTIVEQGRAAAGPKDARLMVGKDFGGLRVENDTRA